ncbi:hypothetical protein FKV24_001410 [Lysobacter maris]|uniref:Uncharacterized protein n=1 Tax=Marilutibacter maris TaxID=1605891 RepID=A0A508B835_9GAMM|nr:DUF6689 family protein [Lysobacter maris]KAB8198580.1 hypothetical protein FKV24_001410 [Lysobacter maris]
MPRVLSRTPSIFAPFRRLQQLMLAALLLAGSGSALAQALPVQVQVSGNTATAQIGVLGQPVADLTLNFDDASGLSASSLGISAKLVNLNNAALLARLPDLQLTQLDSALPLLITVEPPGNGGLSFNRTVRVEVHTHALSYSAGSAYRLFKAPLLGPFRDISDEIAPGSVRARGTTGGFSQFLVLLDLRDTGDVIAAKFDWLRDRVDALPVGVRPGYTASLDAAEAAVASENFATAIAELDTLRANAASQAGGALTQQWQAGGSNNQAGDLIAGAATLKFSIAYLRDYGH